MKLNYKVARLLVLARDGGCVVCRATVDLTTHHRIPKRIRRDDSPANLITLCRLHHAVIEELDALPSYFSWEAYL